MAGPIDVLRAVERAPLRTMRYEDARVLGGNAWRVLDGLVERGALVRLAHGIYTAPPNGLDGRTWKPGLEAAGLAVAAARFGPRNAILMGIGAARHWGAVPRAIANTVIAVPHAGRRAVHTASGTVHLVPRELDRVDATLEMTELGRALIATPEQTLFDLLMRPEQGSEVEEAREAARSLRQMVDGADYGEILTRAARTNKAARDAMHVSGSN